jgi:methylated-DNA-protein-cysteine methyltransferase related protein
VSKGSPFYARIKRQVLQITASVPQGRVVTYKDISAWLDVVPRHVAYILARLDADEQAQIPWFRIVPENGVLVRKRANTFGISQQKLLLDDGLVISLDGCIAGFAQASIDIGDLPISLPKQVRPAHAPVVSRRRSKRPTAF